MATKSTQIRHIANETRNVLRETGQVLRHPVALFVAIPLLVAACASDAKKPVEAPKAPTAAHASPFDTAKNGGSMPVHANAQIPFTPLQEPAAGSGAGQKQEQAFAGLLSQYSDHASAGRILAGLTSLDKIRQRLEPGNAGGITKGQLVIFSAANDSMRLAIAGFAETYYGNPAAPKSPDARPFDMLHMYLWNFLSISDAIATSAGGSSRQAAAFMVGEVANMATATNNAYGPDKAPDPKADSADRASLKSYLQQQDSRRGLGVGAQIETFKTN